VAAGELPLKAEMVVRTTLAITLLLEMDLLPEAGAALLIMMVVAAQAPAAVSACGNGE
jgi:hypothetical protein